MDEAVENKTAHSLKDCLPRFALAGGLLLAAAGLMLLFSQTGTLFFPAYREFSKAVIGALAGIFSVSGYAIWDWAATAAAIFAIARLIRRIARKRPIIPWFANVAVILAALVFFLVGAWGLNHYAPPLADELGLAVGRYSAEELEAATAYYLEQSAALAQSVPRNDDFTMARQDFFELAPIAGAGYVGLASRYPLFAGSQAPVKQLALFGEPLLYGGFTGIFMPFTGEANVPANEAVESMPFTMCHEAAHRLGIANEQEANFAAFLACTESDDVRFRYAGYHEAFGYCLNALAANYPQRTEKMLLAAIGDETNPSDAASFGARLALYDRQNAIEHYRAYEGPAKEAGTVVNDTYLKTFSEESGVKSYGEVADYLIAWHLAQKGAS